MRAADQDRGRRLLDRAVAGIPADETPVRHIEQLPTRPARTADWPKWAPPRLVDALRQRGAREPWVHQAEGAEAVWAGENVIVATGTASGKSLVYQLPVLSRLLDDDRATALYLAPTKALGADQLRTVDELGMKDIRAASYDGDTPQVERDWVRAHGRWIFTNPDMLHYGVLPGHGRWARFFRRLSHIVVDECHTYRGVFGSHVALLLRRLRRIAQHYGADPVFVLASATVSDPASLAERLTGVSCRAVTDDGSPRGARTIAFWEPPLLDEIIGENGAPVRRAAGSEAARIMTELVIEDARMLAFIRSRRGVELAALSAQRALSDVDDSLAAKVAAYRGGYLPEDRRELERSLLSGELRAVATTNALELGVDISGLDAVVVAGYPGTLASFWQQAGRAGRDGEGALGGLRRARRPAGPPTSYTTRRPCCTGRSRRPCSTRPTHTFSNRTWPALRPNCRSTRTPSTPSAANRRDGPCRRSRRTGCCAGARTAGSGPPANVHIGTSSCAAPAGIRSPSWRASPDACSAPWTRTPRARRCTRERCTCTAASRSWWTSWTWRPRSPWCIRRVLIGRPRRATWWTSRCCGPSSGRTPVAASRSASARWKSPRRWSDISGSGHPVPYWTRFHWTYRRRPC